MTGNRWLMAGLLVLAACAPQPGDAAPPAPAAAMGVHPVSGLPVVPLTIRQGVRVHRLRVEVARTSREQAQGLMFRDRMGPDEGMIFPMPAMRPAAFWMKNTPLPLDIIFIAPDGRIANIAANTVPYSLDPIPSAGPVKAVLELNAGRAAQLGITPGALVEW